MVVSSASENPKIPGEILEARLLAAQAAESTAKTTSLALYRALPPDAVLALVAGA
jgi:hypothetical protein